MRCILNNFNEQLSQSQSSQVHAFFDAAYRSYFPSLQTIERKEHDMRAQRAGIDVVVTLLLGTTTRHLAIDEKIRNVDYGDFLLEFESVGVSNTPGWMEKPLAIDYIAYGVLPNTQVHMLPWRLLQRAWTNYGEGWKDRYFISEALNDTYLTRGVCVPHSVVWDAIIQSALITL